MTLTWNTCTRCGTNEAVVGGVWCVACLREVTRQLHEREVLRWQRHYGNCKDYRDELVAMRQEKIELAVIRGVDGDWRNTDLMQDRDTSPYFTRYQFEDTDDDDGE